MRVAMAISLGRRWFGRVLAATVVLGCLAGLTAWRYWPWREKYPVPLPPPAASPGKVVVAYLRSLDAYDTATIRRRHIPPGHLERL